MTQPTIAFLGFGNMGSAIARGLLAAGWQPNQMTAIVGNSTRGHKAAKNLNIPAYPTFAATSQDFTFLLLAIKPQQLAEVAPQLPNIPTTCTILSILAGTTLHTLQNFWPQHVLVRAMPNTPASVGLGMTGLVTQHTLTAASQQSIEHIFQAIGKTLWLTEEAQMDTVTALSGSGPAWFFAFMEALIEAGVQEGLTKEQCLSMVTQTALGAATMAANTPPEQLRQAVTSPGGTTEAGLNALTDHHFHKIIHAMIKQSKHRSQTLSKG